MCFTISGTRFVKITVIKYVNIKFSIFIQRESYFIRFFVSLSDNIKCSKLKITFQIFIINNIPQWLGMSFWEIFTYFYNLTFNIWPVIPKSVMLFHWLQILTFHFLSLVCLRESASCFVIAPSLHPIWLMANQRAAYIPDNTVGIIFYIKLRFKYWNLDRCLSGVVQNSVLLPLIIWTRDPLTLIHILITRQSHALARSEYPGLCLWPQGNFIIKSLHSVKTISWSYALQRVKGSLDRSTWWCRAWSELPIARSKDCGGRQGKTLGPKNCHCCQTFNRAVLSEKVNKLIFENFPSRNDLHDKVKKETT